MTAIDQTSAALAAITGHAPFPWQTRLLDRIVAGDWPDAIDVPTGLGKTRVIPIWLLAHVFSDATLRPPMRLVYVVNRRTIVDQASDVAVKLRDALSSHADLSARWHGKYGNEPLAVSTLRGALADNGEWMRRPHVPAILVGTVDMIGSRLLFDAYRAGRWSKAMHAGLLGQDTLIVHDEVHLSPAFQKLLKWIERRQAHDRSPRPLRVLEMSATGGDAQRPHKIEDDDRALLAVQQRIHAVKRLRVHDVTKNVVDQLARSAFKQEGAGDAARRVIVFVREPKTAQAVVDRLKREHKVDAERIALLTGTIRGFERDELVKKPPLRHLIERTRPERTTYLISTSAGEVGADFDADHLVCDATTLDAMVQRLGRVNRSGALGDLGATVDVLADVTAAKPTEDHKRRMIATTAWLHGLPTLDDGRHDASPDALSTRRKADDAAYRDAASKAPLMIEPHAATLDAWALTSIQDDWPVAAPLDAYLHGLADFEPPRASIAWRGELSAFFPEPDENETRVAYDEAARSESFEKWIDLCPLRPRELLSERCERVIEALKSIAARLSETRRREARFAMLHRGDVTIQTFREFAARAADKDDEKRLAREIADRTFILPADVGGLDGNGMLDGNAASPVLDVADAFDDERKIDVPQRRVRVRLTANSDGELTPTLFDPAARFVTSIDAPDRLSAWTGWRDAVARDPLLADMRQTVRVALDKDDETAADHLLLFRATPPSDGKPVVKVPLGEHNADAGGHAAHFATALVDDALRPAIRLAAACHDYGKHRTTWQASIRNTDPEPLAKSFGLGMDPASLKGYRHEFGSLVDLIDPTKTNVLAAHRAAFAELDDDERDVAMHLIAAHHGRGRPCFPTGAFDPDDPLRADLGDALSPGEIARRYARLQRRFGHWGLAWLESLVMCADHAASRGESPEDEQ